MTIAQIPSSGVVSAFPATHVNARGSEADRLPITSILVSGRYREDLGDLSTLAASIETVGLINPITVAELGENNYRLICGERRLTACRALGWSTIPVRVARSVQDAHDMLVAERDENTERKAMTPVELTKLGMAIEELEKPKARERQGAHGAAPGRRANTSGPETGTVKRGHESRELAAEAVGLSTATYRRVKAAINAASNEAEHAEVREVASAATTAINTGAPIAPTVARIGKKRQEVAEHPIAAAPTPGKPGPHGLDWATVAEKARDYKRLEDAHAALAPDLSLEYFRSQLRPHGVTWNAKVISRLTEQANDIVQRVGDNVLGHAQTAVEALSVADLDLVDAETASIALQQLEDAASVIRKELIKTLKGIAS